INKAQKNSKSILLTYKIITPLGNKKWIERKECYIRDNNGNLLQTKGTLQDITEIKKKELSQIKLVDELNKKNNELMQFNYIVSHNLRSPVAKIMSLTSLINIVEEEEKSEIIDYLSISAKQLDEVIKDLNQILSSKSTISDIREKISFKDLLVRIFDSIEKQIIESNAIINTDIDKNFPDIISIKSYLESIFYNLISNSIKYRSTKRKLEINIYINKVKNNFIINVIDNGIGIDLKRHNKDLFTLYKRFNYDVEGKGMGLHMTKNQVEALGGKISIASKLNQGTVITVILPNKN
ncbi:MAG: sensor histidine kinase, partial [Candidatus Sericytochromatia bacterium]